MKRLDSPDELSLTRPVVAIGNFDGVHLGHQLLLRHMQELAAQHGLPSVVVTFFPPSKALFQGTSFLASDEEKFALLAAFAPAAVVMVPFTFDYARTPKDVFLAQLARLGPHTLIVGEDFRFGHKREGTLNDLSHVPEKLEVFALKRAGEAVISSSRIRALLQEGRVAEVAPLLGRPYAARGTVTEGDRRGRTIGFPTANLALPEGKALPLGVFAVRTATPVGVVPGMANVGPRPSYPEGAPALEVHLFDFDGDLYGQTLEVRFVDKLRDQVRFSSLHELKAQLGRDQNRALEVLEER